MATLAATTTAHGNKPSNFVAAMDYSTYYRRSTSNIIVQWIDNPSSPPTAVNFASLSSFRAAHPKYEQHNPQDLTTPTPLFVDCAIVPATWVPWPWSSSACSLSPTKS